MTVDCRANLMAELDRRRLMTVARLGRDGWPLSTTVGYANDGAIIYFIVPADSEAFADLDADARISLCLGEEAPQPMAMGLRRTYVVLPRLVRSADASEAKPLEAAVCEVTGKAERAWAVSLLATRYPGLGPVMERANENGAQLRLMRAVPFIGAAPKIAANAA